MANRRNVVGVHGWPEHRRDYPAKEDLEFKQIYKDRYGAYPEKGPIIYYWEKSHTRDEPGDRELFHRMPKRYAPSTAYKYYKAYLRRRGSLEPDIPQASWDVIRKKIEIEKLKNILQFSAGLTTALLTDLDCVVDCFSDDGVSLETMSFIWPLANYQSWNGVDRPKRQKIYDLAIVQAASKPQILWAAKESPVLATLADQHIFMVTSGDYKRIHDN